MNPENAKKDQTEKWKEELSCLEKAASTALVPGEMDDWIRTVRQSLRSFQSPWNQYLQKKRDACEKILSQDLELAPRVEKLKKSWSRLDTELIEIAGELEFLFNRSPKSESQQKLVQSAEALRKKILQWIVDSRALDSSQQTWFLEAVYRDRGVGD